MNGDVGDDQLEIAVELRRNGARLIAIIDDSGRPFDPTQVRTSALVTSLDEAEAGNLGIHLLRSFANDMDYERRDGRSRLTLQFANQENAGLDVADDGRGLHLAELVERGREQPGEPTGAPLKKRLVA